MTKQNVTIRVDREKLRKLKIQAARRETSLSALLSSHIERLVNEDDAYEKAKRHANAFLEEGLHPGGDLMHARCKWHER